jgi:hypothetical protein
VPASGKRGATFSHSHHDCACDGVGARYKHFCMLHMILTCIYLRFHLKIPAGCDECKFNKVQLSTGQNNQEKHISDGK